MLQTSREFKASETVVRKLYEVIWNDPTPHIYIVSYITEPERVGVITLSNYPANQLCVTVLISHK